MACKHLSSDPAAGNVSHVQRELEIAFKLSRSNNRYLAKFSGDVAFNTSP
jgi:hypothetical protein